MAPHNCRILAFLVGLVLLSSTPALGNIECEELPVEDCAFAVASSGARCVLEKDVQVDGSPEYKCQTSIIMAERPVEWIETDKCIKTCGLQRLAVGLSTDALLEREFTKKLCLSNCRNECPNINDLYTKLAAGEGIYLPSLCDSLMPKPRRQLIASPKIKPVSIKSEDITAFELQAFAPNSAKSSPVSSPRSQIGSSPQEAPSSTPDNYANEPYPALEPPFYESPYAEEPSPYAEDPSPLIVQPPTYSEPPYAAEQPSPSPTMTGLPPAEAPEQQVYGGTIAEAPTLIPRAYTGL